MRDITKKEVERLLEMSLTVVHLSMCSDNQPERALTNWLNDFVEFATEREMINKDTGESSVFTVNQLLSIIENFVETKKIVEKEENK